MMPYMTEKNNPTNDNNMPQYPNQQQQQQNPNSLYTPAQGLNTHRRPSNDVWLPQRPSVAEQRGQSSLPFR
jgi:hypothetical protein